MGRRAPILLLLVAAAAPAAIAAAPATTARGSQITLNLKDANIRQVAQMVSSITGKNFIIDPRVEGRVTVISSKPISADALFSVFLSVLDVHSLSAVPTGNDTWKIVPAVEGRQAPGVGSAQLASAPSDAMLTQVLQLKNVEAAQIVPALRPLMSSYAQLAAYAPSNMLIISGRVGNVRRIIALAHRLDQPLSSGFDMIQLQHASATNVAQVLTSMLQGSSGHGQLPLKLAADPRTNTILVSGSPAQRLQVKAIVSELDQPSGHGGNTRVVYLHYAQAEDLAKILQSYIKTQVQAPAGGDKSAGASEPKIDVIADKALNALIVTAPPKEMSEIGQIISDLDVRRAQVLVQGIIAELSSNAASQLGISWAAESSAAAGLTNFPNGVVDLGSLVQGAGSGASSGVSLNSSDVPGGLLFGIGRIVKNGTSFVALLNALTSSADTNILSTPSLVTLDNEKSTLISGQKVPFVTGQYVNTGQSTGSATNLINPFQTVEEQQLGLELDIQPQINYGGDTVSLNIDLKDSTLGSVQPGTTQPSINNRQLKTTIVAKNHQIIVLGGLIDTQLQETRQKVPLLGDIPLLGNLFRYRSSNKTRQNLMIFLRPVILRNAHDTDAVSQPRYNGIRELQLGRGTSVPLLPGVKPPVLPQFEAAPAATGSAAPESATLIRAAPAPSTSGPTHGNGG